MESYPVRTRSLHIVNAPRGFDTIMKIFLSLVSEKIRGRVFMHTSFESLHKILPKTVLPKEYGGDAGTIEDIAGKITQRFLSIV